MCLTDWQTHMPLKFRMLDRVPGRRARLASRVRREAHRDERGGSRADAVRPELTLCADCMLSEAPAGTVSPM